MEKKSTRLHFIDGVIDIVVSEGLHEARARRDEHLAVLHGHVHKRAVVAALLAELGRNSQINQRKDNKYYLKYEKIGDIRRKVRPSGREAGE